MKTKICMNCGRRILDAERFCRYCGTDNSVEAIESCIRKEAEKRSEEESKDEVKGQKEEREIVIESANIVTLKGYSRHSNILFRDNNVYFIVRDTDGFSMSIINILNLDHSLKELQELSSLPADTYFEICINELDGSFCIKTGSKYKFWFDSECTCIQQKDITKTGFDESVFYQTELFAHQNIIISNGLEEILEIEFSPIFIGEVKLCGVSGGMYILKADANAGGYIYIVVNTERSTINCYVKNAIHKDISVQVVNQKDGIASWNTNIYNNCGEMMVNVKEKCLVYWNDEGTLNYHDISFDELEIYNFKKDRDNLIIYGGRKLDVFMVSHEKYIIRTKQENGFNRYIINNKNFLKISSIDDEIAYGEEGQNLYIFYVDGSLVSKIIRFE